MGAPSAPVIPGAGGRCIRTREHERLAGGYKGVTFMTKQNKKHRARHRGRHVQLYAYFATAVEAAKAFDGAVRRTIEVHKNLSYSGPLSDKQGYMFRAMLQINFPTTEEKAFMRNYEQNWRRKPFELRLEDSDGGVVEWKYETQCIHGIKDYDDGGFRCSINENKSQPEPSLRQRKRPDRVI
ncbi:hypothetical protein NFJ02_20g42520 [Pycnococcus provasolii]